MFHVNYIVGLAEYMDVQEVIAVINALGQKIGHDNIWTDHLRFSQAEVHKPKPVPRRVKIEFDYQDDILQTAEINELKNGYEGMNGFGGAILRTKIEVIKMVRARTGMGLKKSKEAVDRYIERCTVEDK